MDKDRSVDDVLQEVIYYGEWNISATRSKGGGGINKSEAKAELFEIAKRELEKEKDKPYTHMCSFNEGIDKAIQVMAKIYGVTNEEN